jgi:hypothetical protein
MEMKIDIPDDVADELMFEAAEMELSVHEYVLQVIDARQFVLPEDRRPKTGAELVEYWRRAGIIGSRSDITDSVEYARELRRKAERRNHD